jgi:choline-sulfatase
MKALLGALLVVLILPAAVRAQRSPGPNPDVFLITIDTVRADHVRCYGYERIQTPALDSLAQEGARFAAAFTASPITNSSHATILTGDLPSTHGVTDFAVPLKPAVPTWAEFLKQAGYQTAAFIGAAILDSKSLAPGFDRGFDFYDNFTPQPAGASRWGRVERRGMVVVQHAERWLDQHPGGRRFVWVHLYDPHDPYDPPEPYAQTYKDRLYDGEIAYADAALGDFLAYLRRHAWFDKALIVAVGDHGEGLGQHGEDTHGIFLYDSTLHVPLIIKAPRQHAGEVVGAQARTTDILPTVIELLGLKTAAKFDGESLRPSLQGAPARQQPPVIAQTDYPLSFGWAPLRALRAPNYKFIEAPRPELYDLGRDPEELHNLYEPWNTEVLQSRALLAQVRDQHPAAAAAPVGQGTLDELRALGYLGPEGATTVPEPSLLPDPKDRIEEQNLLQRAMLAADDHRTGEARAALRQLLQSDPKSLPALAQLGKLELAAGNYRDAADLLKRAQSVRSSGSTALALGQALEKLGDLAGAGAALESSLRENPRQPEARISLGDIYLRLNDAARAEDQYTAVLLLNPQSVPAHLGLGRARLQQRDGLGAIEELKAATRLDPQNRQAYEALSQAYASRGQKRLAAEAAQRAARLPGYTR